MKNLGAKWLVLLAAFGTAAGLSSLNGCGGGDGGGKGGTTGTGGKGGTTGTGGRGGTGTAGTGGASTGGRGGGGGTAGTAGGAGGTAGTGGGAGASEPPCSLLTFTSDAQSTGFNAGNTQSGNLANLEGGTPATIAWDGTMGEPLPGSLKINAPFSDYNQFVDVSHNLGASMLKNWSGLKLHVKVKVASGGNPTTENPMGIQPYVNTGASYKFCGKYTNLVAGNGWNDYVVDLTADCTTAGIDPTMVIQYGVQIQAGNGTNSDGGINPSKPTAAVIYVDSFYLEGTCPTGGTGGAGGGGGGAGGAGGSGGGGAKGGAGGGGGATGGAGGATGGSGGAGGTSGGSGGAKGGSGGGGGATGGAGGATGGAGGATGGSGGATGGSGGAGGSSGGSGGSGGAGGASGGSGGAGGGGGAA